MVRVKTDKFPDVRVSPKLKQETEKAAEKEGMNMSEYIRESVKEKNKKVLKNGDSD
jgi:predicted HicB family RNase H-like nuclease